MTENKKSAGYFDSNRNCPMYEGDVYFKEGYIEPYFRIVKTEEKGFLVHHIGSTETFALSSMGAELVQATYIGNQIDNPNVVAEHKAALEAAKNQPVCEIVEADAAASEPVAETEALFGNEETAEKINEEVKADIAADSEPEEKEGENEQNGSNSSDVTDAENEPNTDEIQTDGTGTDNETDAAEQPAEAADDKPAKKSNVIVEVAKEAVPEVIANTKEEKNAVQRRNFVANLIKKNKAEIEKLEEKAEYHNELASTLDFEPFVKLKNLVREDLHTKIDDENVKGIKERTKDFESIVNIQNLLKDHRQKAADAENHIADLEDEISKFEDEIAELEAKIDTFARQQKLNLDAAATPAEPEAAEVKAETVENTEAEEPVAEAAAEEIADAEAMSDEEALAEAKSITEE